MTTRRIDLRRLRRIFASAAAIVVGVYVSYFVVVNAMLETGALKVVVNHLAPNHVRIEYASAWSPWFMRVHTKGFSVRGTDSAVEWRITLDEAQTTFGLTDFLSRRLHMFDARARGVSVRIRFKIAPSEATPDYVAKLPPIEGLPDPPLVPAVLPPPPDDAHYALWTVQLDDCVAEEVHEVWTDTVRVTDVGGSARGGFYLKPLRHVHVEPTEIRPLDATVHNGKRTVASDAHGVVAVTLHDYDIRNVTGMATLKQLDGRVIGSAKVVDLDVVNRLHTGIAIARGAGAVRLAVGIERGELLAGTRVSYDTKGVDATMDADRVSFATQASVWVPRDGKPHIQAFASLGDVALHHRSAEVARAEYVGVAARVENVDLSRPFDRWATSTDVPNASIANLATLDAYSDDLPFEGGFAHASGHADIDSAGARGHAKANFTHLAVKVGTTLATANGRGEVVLGHWDSASGHGELSNVRVDFEDVSAGRVSGWWAALATGPIPFRTRKPWAIATITGKCKDAQLPLSMLDAPGVVKTAAGHQPFTVSLRTGLNGEGIDASDIRAIGDSLEVYAHYRAWTKNGAGIVLTPIANVGFEIVAGKVSIRPFASRSWYERTREAPSARGSR